MKPPGQPRRSGLARGQQWLRRSRYPIPARSEKRIEQAPERAAVVEAALRRDAWACQAQARIRALPDAFERGLGECDGPLDVHEIIPRSAWPGGELVLANVLCVCRRCHQWIDNHPDEAHALSLHGYSWERPPARVGSQYIPAAAEGECE